ncbi:GDP-mannose 4,6-dehydratase [Rhodocytophaga rosea]|uniref:GDP-mannose 4,6-dehydratase n=1 Tax=Rhodocytophaga rosea TaxID=2704465 RepID=A0A6C0GJP9_9BACT|nr:GDP-mannose 4,6-dehydratase [Rhodocytophaga rosea]QHT68215.1 GDP-mannose 4,6-dehydratase [Rhodocytophaga rosea]
MKTAIITGITGQDGAYLAKLLLEKGYQVIGLSRDLLNCNVKNLEYLQIAEKVHLIELNLLDLSRVSRVIEKFEPDEIYNLAAQSSVGSSFDNPIDTLEYNTTSVANFLESIRKINSRIKFYQASSSEMFGYIKEENLPIKESLIFHPVSPYGVSKASAHWLSVNYREAYGMFTACGILFNHESALRGENYVIKKVINNAVRIKNGLPAHLQLGNLAIKRDWGYAPKYVEAMWLMLQDDVPGDYIICSGEAVSLESFIHKVFQQLNLDVEKYVSINPGLLRPLDLPVIYGDNTKAKKELGWEYNLNTDALIHTLIEDEMQWLEWNLSQSFASQSKAGI